VKNLREDSIVSRRIRGGLPSGEVQTFDQRTVRRRGVLRLEVVGDDPRDGFEMHSALTVTKWGERASIAPFPPYGQLTRP
jgi:hypothetical protein